jgi:hypothetical protein
MLYHDIPVKSIWMRDALSTQGSVVGSLTTIRIIGDLLDRLHNKIIAQSERIELLNNILQEIRNCNPEEARMNTAMAALNNIVEYGINKYQSMKTYVNVVFIAWNVRTSFWELDNQKWVPSYKGCENSRDDMICRAKLIKHAIRDAKKYLPAIERLDHKTLKVFMAPEFYFRGKDGAYPPEIVSQIIPFMREGNDGTGGADYNDWLFVFGTAVTGTIITKHYCNKCKSADHVVFKKNKNNNLLTVPTCSLCGDHDVQEKDVGAIIDNVALIQKGNKEYLVTKEFMSNIDFKKKGGSDVVDLMDISKGGKRSFQALPTEGARSCMDNKPVNERKGGAVFSIDGIDIGVEICLDHKMERLENSGRLQILLIPSAGMTINDGTQKNNCITFNVDGSRVDSALKVNNKGHISLPYRSSFGFPETSLLDTGTSKIHIYKAQAIPY